MDLRNVNFLIMGTQKGGTTALATFLSQHPEICLAPAKEVHFFDNPELAGADWAAPTVRHRYAEAFPNFRGEPLVGEATPIYMYLPTVAPAIARYNSEMKLIVLLREPVARAVSHYLHTRRHGHESWPFVQALWLEHRRLLRDRAAVGPDSSLRWHSYVDRGRYANQLRNLLTYFDREQLLILRTEDLRQRHDETLTRVYEFLGVQRPTTMPTVEKIHASSGSCWKPAMAQRWIARQCLDSTIEIERLLGWDLSEWRRLAKPSS